MSCKHFRPVWTCSSPIVPWLPCLSPLRPLIFFHYQGYSMGWSTFETSILCYVFTATWNTYCASFCRQCSNEIVLIPITPLPILSCQENVGFRMALLFSMLLSNRFLLQSRLSIVFILFLSFFNTFDLINIVVLFIDNIFYHRCWSFCWLMFLTSRLVCLTNYKQFSQLLSFYSTNALFCQKFHSYFRSLTIN